jgi:hypothetical protein
MQLHIRKFLPQFGPFTLALLNAVFSKAPKAAIRRNPNTLWGFGFRNRQKSYAFSRASCLFARILNALLYLFESF